MLLKVSPVMARVSAYIGQQIAGAENNSARIMEKELGGR